MEGRAGLLLSSGQQASTLCSLSQVRTIYPCQSLILMSTHINISMLKLTKHVVTGPGLFRAAVANPAIPARRNFMSCLLFNVLKSLKMFWQRSSICGNITAMLIECVSTPSVQSSSWLTWIMMLRKSACNWWAMCIKAQCFPVSVWMLTLMIRARISISPRWPVSIGSTIDRMVPAHRHGACNAVCDAAVCGARAHSHPGSHGHGRGGSRAHARRL